MENKLPKISVIIPVLNGAKTLNKCLVSVTNQDFDDYEIILIDNGSTDNTKEIINQFLKDSHKIIYIFEPKRGRGQARNVGVAAARGDIVAMTDADCIVPFDWLRNITKPIIEDRALAVIGFEKEAACNYWSRLRQAEDWRFLKTKIEGDYVNHLDTKNFAIKAELLKKMGFDSQLAAYEDWDLFIRLKKIGIKIMFLPELLVEHHHDASARELAITQFSRAQGVVFIMNKYRDDEQFHKLFKNDESASSIKNINFLFFIPWAIWQLVAHSEQAPYRIISDLAWKIGIIAALF